MSRPRDQVTGDHGQAASCRDPGERRSTKPRRERAAQRDAEQHDREHEGESGIAAHRMEDQQAKPDDLQPQRQGTGGSRGDKQPGWRASVRRYARFGGTRKLRIWQGDDGRQQIKARGDQRCSAQTQGTDQVEQRWSDRKSTRLNSSHVKISYAVFCLKKKKKEKRTITKTK